tara:strand:+ start:21327 stop:21716 length:390 start_codon:yes stop_codon:yes gene_type:complete
MPITNKKSWWNHALISAALTAILAYLVMLVIALLPFDISPVMMAAIALSVAGTFPVAYYAGREVRDWERTHGGITGLRKLGIMLRIWTWGTDNRNDFLFSFVGAGAALTIIMILTGVIDLTGALSSWIG